MSTDEWIKDRIEHLKCLKAPTDAQRLLMLLADKPERTAAESKKLAILVTAERATERASKARAAASKFLRTEQQAEATKARKARDHALYQSAQLFVLAELVNPKTGEFTRDRGAVLGALLAVASTADDQRWAAWKVKGDALIAESENQP